MPTRAPAGPGARGRGGLGARGESTEAATAMRRLLDTPGMEDGGFDVVVVGASTAGCTAARLFGQAGARVALIEKRPDADAYKVTCTHAILSSAAPTIGRIGLAPRLEARGAPRVA